jgi:hypothetical protein
MTTRAWALYMLTARCGMSVLDAMRKLDICDEFRGSYERLVEVEMAGRGYHAGAHGDAAAAA